MSTIQGSKVQNSNVANPKVLILAKTIKMHQCALATLYFGILLSQFTHNVDFVVIHVGPLNKLFISITFKGRSNH